MAYGNALIAARGYASAPETTEAFARARKSASGDEDATERLAADTAYGSAASCGRVAVDADARGGLPRRRRGETQFARGRRRPSRRRDHMLVRRRVSRGAGSLLKRALALFQPGRDDDLAFRFGQDAGVAAMGYLAIASVAAGRSRSRDFAR